VRSLGVTDARRAAHAVREAVFGTRRADAPLCDLSDAVHLARAEVVDRDLAAGGDGCQALLIPLRADRFRIVVDVTPRDGWAGVAASVRGEVADHRRRFRVGHELGHTFFYSRKPDALPRRILEGSDREERFCDEFARALLLPTRVAKECRSLKGLVRVQARYAVSLELAARTLAETSSTELALFYWDAATGRPGVQWTNVTSAWRLARWSEAMARAIKGGGTRGVGSADTILLGSRNQAIVAATR
jgi:hypothetical protein